MSAVEGAAPFPRFSTGRCAYDQQVDWVNLVGVGMDHDVADTGNSSHDRAAETTALGRGNKTGLQVDECPVDDDRGEACFVSRRTALGPSPVLRRLFHRRHRRAP